MESHPLFRKIPPWIEILDIFKILDLPTEFPYSFTKDMIQLDFSSYAKDLLYPYYKPCKAKQFLDNIMDEIRWITVLRHCLFLHGYTMDRQETTREYKKVIIYTISRSTDSIHTMVAVDFS